MKKLHIILGALVLAFTGSAHAISMTDLINGGSIQVNDKLFDNWEVLFEDTSDFHAVDTDNIEVSGLVDGGLDPGPGLRFDILNGEFDVTGDGLFAYIDFMFGFRVSVLDPDLLIKDNSLSITDAFVTNSGDNGIAIQEFVATDPSLVEVPGDISLPDLGIKYVEFSWLDPGPAFAELSDSASFAPLSEIWVSKDIFVWAWDVNETASLSGFEQRFSQVPVPEPATWLLLGAGLAVVGAVRRRKV